MTQETKMAGARAKKYSLDLSRYYRKPSTQVSLSIVLSLFIVAFFILVALKPTFVTIAKLNTEIEESEKTLTQLSTKATSLESAARLWEELQPLLPYVESSIPQDSPAYQSLTKSIETLAQEVGVEISSLSVGRALLYSQTIDIYGGKDQDVVEMELSVRVVGSFSQTLEFLQEILNLDRLIGLSSITINKEVLKANDSQVGMSITGTAQYLADPKQLEKAIVEKKK